MKTEIEKNVNIFSKSSIDMHITWLPFSNETGVYIDSMIGNFL